MKALGLDIDNDDDVNLFVEKTFEKYINATNAAVRKHSEAATIFHNRGHVCPGNRFFINANIVARMQNPYFNRTREQFCSHISHTKQSC